MNRLVAFLLFALLSLVPDLASAFPRAMFLQSAPAIVTSAWSPTDKDASITLSNGNRTATGTTASAYRSIRGTQSRTFASGGAKYQFEVKIDAPVGALAVGIARSTASLTNYFGVDSDSMAAHSGAGFYYNNSSQFNVPTFTTNSVLSYVFDSNAGSLSVYHNGSLLGTVTLINGTWFPGFTSRESGDRVTLNTGQSAFAYPISGAVPWG